jgi:FMNH2-dependent dimethyl sulfone monooxygenase
MAMRGVTRDRFPDDFEERRYHQANGMGGVPIVGNADTVARELAQLAAAGATGIGLSFVNYLDELPFFRDEVMPRLTRMRLRGTN